MNWDLVKGNWKQVQGKVKQQWAKLTDDDLLLIEGERDKRARQASRQTARKIRNGQRRSPKTIRRLLHQALEFSVFQI